MNVHASTLSSDVLAVQLCWIKNLWHADILLFNFKDDIGDKSVFMFKALAEDEKKALIEKLEQQKYSQNN